MEKKEFLKKKEEYQQQISDINLKIHYLKSEYINTSPMKQFKIGDKVVVNKRGRNPIYGFVTGYNIGRFSNEVIVELVQCKKDGPPSKKKLDYWPEYGDYVEKYKVLEI